MIEANATKSGMAARFAFQKRDAGDLQSIHDVRKRRAPQENRALENHRLTTRSPGELRSIPDDPSRCRLKEAMTESDEDALTGTVRTHDYRARARLKLQRHAVNDATLSDGERHVVEV